MYLRLSGIDRRKRSGPIVAGVEPKKSKAQRWWSVLRASEALLGEVAMEPWKYIR